MTKFFSRVRSTLRLRRAARRRAVVAVLLSAAALAVGISAIANATGSAPLFLITPTGLNFGYAPVGSKTPSQVVTIKNVSGQPQTMSGAGGNPNPPFDASQNCQGITLAPGASCKMIYSFSPTATGPVSATSSPTWNGQSVSVSLAGTGTPHFLITPTKLNFGYVKVGHTSAPQAVTIKNVSNQSVVMSGAGGNPNPPFNASQNCQGITLAPGASCKMIYSFSPTATGPVSATSSPTWNGQSVSVSLAGRGTP